ncbi:MAG: reverse transcriptase domain-containing protein [Cyanobacteria bacterium J06635_10]
MRKAETVLGIIHERGKRELPLEDVYRQLFNPDLFLLAYGRIYRNSGSLTPGVTDETVDGMSRAKIDTIIHDLRYERYRWMPARRVHIKKKNSSKKRPLGIPRWSDKLLQEVIRLILEAYYEPQFSPTSHGFRTDRGCHTALSEIYSKWVGTKWFVEGDIAQCFDSLDHTILLNILREKTHDNRFLRLIENLLRVGYLEEWRYNATLSGSPQGAILSPILANIYLSRFDKFVVEELIPKYNRGKARQPNREWQGLQGQRLRLKKKGLLKEANAARRLMQQVPSLDPQDPNYQSLRYVRYADDWLIGFSGPRQEAEEIKGEIGNFLRNNLKLELSEAKTLISHARTEAARFLGYDIVVLNNNQKLDKRGHRSINGQIGLKVPPDVVKSKCARFLLHGKPIHRAELIHDSVFSIVAQYQHEFRGIVEYYRLSNNLHQLNRLKWVMERSLTQTLAHKLRISVKKIYRRYQTTLQTRNGTYMGLQVTVERPEGQKPLVANWGGISLKRNMKAVLNDSPLRIDGPRTELERRLMANTCELCGSQENVQVHHVRALKDLQKKGRTKPPYWVQIMAARERKTLVVCQQCHMDIHAGRVTQRTNTAM